MIKRKFYTAIDDKSATHRFLRGCILAFSFFLETVKNEKSRVEKHGFYYFFIKKLKKILKNLLKYDKNGGHTTRGMLYCKYDKTCLARLSKSNR